MLDKILPPLEMMPESVVTPVPKSAIAIKLPLPRGVGNVTVPPVGTI